MSDIPIDDNIVVRGEGRYLPYEEEGDYDDAYFSTDPTSADIADNDLVPFYDTSESAQKNSLWSNIVAKIKAALGIASSGSTYLKKDGTWGTPANTTYTFATGDSNGQIKVTPSGGSAQNVSVKGLGTAAYTASTAYAVSKALTNEDLNNVTAPGFYNAGGGNTCTNTGLDSGTAFGLQVVHTAAGSYYYQIINPCGSNDFYRRVCSNGTWSSWTKDNYTNTWRGIQNNLTSDSTTDSLSAAQGKALANGSARDSTKLPLAGGTVTGTLILSRTTDASGTANNKPALIIGGTDAQQHIEIDSNEIQAKASGTTTDALNLNNDGGNVYINGHLAAKCTSAPTNGQIMIADGTGGNIKSSGYTIAKSVPSDAKFSDTTYPKAIKNITGSTSTMTYTATCYDDSVLLIPAIYDWRPVVNNLTSDATTSSLSAAQGKALANGSARDSTKLPRTGGTLSGKLTVDYANGTTSSVGDSYIEIGNRTAQGTAGNSYGGLIIDSKTEYYGGISTNNQTQNVWFLLPTKTSSQVFTTANSSSYRVKENIRDMTDEEAQKILDVNVIKFDYKEEYGGDVDQSGVIAEEVIDIIPEVVEKSPFYDETKAIDFKDNPPLTVDYGKFAPYLIKMIQMQQERIDRLESIIEELRR